VIVERVTCRRPGGRDLWPFTMPVVAQIIEDGLEFTAPVTFLVGDNGSGKSTIVEAIADVSRPDFNEAGHHFAPFHAKRLVWRLVCHDLWSRFG